MMNPQFILETIDLVLHCGCTMIVIHVTYAEFSLSSLSLSLKRHFLGDSSSM